MLIHWYQLNNRSIYNINTINHSPQERRACLTLNNLSSVPYTWITTRNAMPRAALLWEVSKMKAGTTLKRCLEDGLCHQPQLVTLSKTKQPLPGQITSWSVSYGYLISLPRVYSPSCLHMHTRSTLSEGRLWITPIPPCFKQCTIYHVTNLHTVPAQLTVLSALCQQVFNF